MSEEIHRFLDEVRSIYNGVIIGPDSKIDRGQALWSQFETAASACRKDDPARIRCLTERVNELVVAKLLAESQNIHSIVYEPDIGGVGRIDFVADRGNDNLYVEVKTVHPRTEDNSAAWEGYVRRSQYHPENVTFCANREFMGAAIYGNTFASRSHFLEYALGFETRLAAAKVIRGGPGILVFCGNGFDWHLSDLEDFADFYRSGEHRDDDPFARMEKHLIMQNAIQIQRNIDHIAFVRRPVAQATCAEFVRSVRGPTFPG